MNNLPDDLLIQIFSRLKLNALKSLRFNSRYFLQLINSIRYYDQVEISQLKDFELKIINIKINQNISNDFSEIVKLQNIEQLDLSGCVSFTQNGLHQLKELIHLEILDLTDCTNIVNDDLSNLEGLNRLRTLRLKGCQEISNTGIEQIKHLKLDLLDVSYCDKIIRGFNFKHNFKKIMFHWLDQYSGMTISLPEYFD